MKNHVSTIELTLSRRCLSGYGHRQRIRDFVLLLLCFTLAGCTQAQSDSSAEGVDIATCPPIDVSVSDDPDVASVTTAAVNWLSSLDEGTAQRVRYCLGDQEMHSWTNVPGTRWGGIELRDLTKQQQQLAWNLVSVFLSESGSVKAKLIANEITQRARATPLGSHTVALFGDPRQDGAWGFQLDGHHLALNFVVQESDIVLAPAFLGAQPLSVNGQAPLLDEARLGRDLIQAFTENERALAKQEALIGRDVIVGSGRGHLDRGRTYDVSRFEGIGLPIASLSNQSANVVNDLIDEYINNLAEPFAGRVRATVDEALDDGYVVFDTRNEDIYYRVFVPNRMLIEYNDVSSDHVHTVFRLLGDDSFSDYGAYAETGRAPRTIAEHYSTSRHHQIALNKSQSMRLNARSN